MRNSKFILALGLLSTLMYTACTGPKPVEKAANKNTPASYLGSQDSTNSAKVKWRDFFTDPYLHALIDTALVNNQELSIMMQEIAISQNEVRARKGEYLPFLGVGAASGVEKVGRYTSQGANDANTDIKPGQKFPEPLPNFMFGAYASWEIDIWNKLHNAKKAAVFNYLSSVEGRNYATTRLIAELANSYYELMALDNQLEILKQNIEIQTNALEIVRLEKSAAKVTELAVRKFEAEVYKNKSLQFAIQQQIVETENRINFLVGRYPQPVLRNSQKFPELVPTVMFGGLPTQLLANRPDVRQAEMQLEAAKLSAKAAKANFYPSLTLRAGAGFEAFNPTYLIQTPESMLYSIAGDLMAPLINRNAIKANYNTASAKQLQAVFQFNRTLLTAHVEVVNQLSKINNLEKSYDLKSKQVQALTQSIEISTVLFRSARADYMEVLMTQRDALESKFELIETKKQQLNAMVNVYQALGGGWN